MNTGTVERNTCVVYSHTFSNNTKYFGNGVSEKRAYKQSSRGKRYLNQFDLDPNPKIDILATGLTPAEADFLERTLFDEYVDVGGLRIQNRPSGQDLQKSVTGANSEAFKIYSSTPRSVEAIEKLRLSHFGNTSGAGNKGKKHSPEHIEKRRVALLGNTHTLGKRIHRAVISMLDGRVTSSNNTTKWNKNNPSYIGTWVDL